MVQTFFSKYERESLELGKKKDWIHFDSVLVNTIKPT